MRKYQEVSPALQPLVEQPKIAPAGFDETRQFLNLRNADGGLQVCGLEIVADVRIDVLVIVAIRQLALLPLKTFPASVGFTRLTPAIAPPIAKRFEPT